MKNLFTAANQLTLGRILLVPFLVWALLFCSPERDDLRQLALAIFLLAVFTDFADGWVARRFSQQTRLGAILDPFADKLLLLSAFWGIYESGPHLSVHLPFGLVVILVTRDILLLWGSTLMYFFYGILPASSTILGKISTFFQVMTILAVLVQWPQATWLGYLAVIFALGAGWDYVRQGSLAIRWSAISVRRREKQQFFKERINFLERSRQP